MIFIIKFHLFDVGFHVSFQRFEFERTQKILSAYGFTDLARLMFTLSSFLLSNNFILFSSILIQLGNASQFTPCTKLHEQPKSKQNIFLISIFMSSLLCAFFIVLSEWVWWVESGISEKSVQPTTVTSLISIVEYFMCHLIH